MRENWRTQRKTPKHGERMQTPCTQAMRQQSNPISGGARWQCHSPLNSLFEWISFHNAELQHNSTKKKVHQKWPKMFPQFIALVRQASRDQGWPWRCWKDSHEIYIRKSVHRATLSQTLHKLITERKVIWNVIRLYSNVILINYCVVIFIAVWIRAQHPSR